MSWMQPVFFLTLPFLSVGFALVFVRVIRGPSLPDRVVALDLIGVVAIGFISNYAVATDQPVYLNVAAVVALIAFLATVAFAYYIRRGA